MTGASGLHAFTLERFFSMSSAKSLKPRYVFRHARTFEGCDGVWVATMRFSEPSQSCIVLWGEHDAEVVRTHVRRRNVNGVCRSAPPPARPYPTAAIAPGRPPEPVECCE